MQEVVSHTTGLRNDDCCMIIHNSHLLCCCNKLHKVLDSNATRPHIPTTRSSPKDQLFPKFLALFAFEVERKGRKYLSCGILCTWTDPSGGGYYEIVNLSALMVLIHTLEDIIYIRIMTTNNGAKCMREFLLVLIIIPTR